MGALLLHPIFWRMLLLLLLLLLLPRSSPVLQGHMAALPPIACLWWTQLRLLALYAQASWYTAECFVSLPVGQHRAWVLLLG